LRITNRLRAMLTGTMGRPDSIATRNMPPLKRPTRPSALRVPSGKTINDLAPLTRRAIFFTIPGPGFLRSTRR
jgi:hypothetical protein